ncbi:cryptochrome/photolyase family protein [Thiocystis violacea]|uniref:cryptochrome/photolyase family protein n=1 Tax=Thiocystis violacea TaxID=13725 RepID=UPI0019061D8A|nr:deoxyribodipyrimidine photo-lyase [Thiocystis violacea]MBK1724481.1 deoxyribodipyrimidine photolyase [Thiocystis violacea]
MTAILWLRRDLRLDDNPALMAALDSDQGVLPLYIHAPNEEAPWAPGGASQWWLHGSLRSLDEALRQRGSRLRIERGDSLAVLRRVIAESSATEVHWNRLYDPEARARDARIKQALRADGLRCESHKASLLFEPWEITKSDGQPYRVFSAFWRACVKSLAHPRPVAAPARLPATAPPSGAIALDDLQLLPRIRWDQGLQSSWQPGEPAALALAERFLHAQVEDYKAARDLPGVVGTSRLSPYLHFGEISPRRILALVMDAFGDPTSEPVESFVREIGWREFAYHLLYHFPQTPTEPLEARFADFPWSSAENQGALDAWQRGQTGIPLVDAGMRELWHSGWMHNRVRMVVASLLTKNLLIPWQAGARWFWDTLVDADLASNTQGWQWTAGCGADAAPYFRVFNPIRQGERFDPQGSYVRRWCPELARLPDSHIHQPWAAPQPTLRAAGVSIGGNYPAPIVDLAASRLRALAAYERIKG